MADIHGLVNYEQLFDLELLHPATDEPLGIVWHIRSSSSPEAKHVLRGQIDENLDRQQRRKLIKGAALERQELEKAASYVAGWSWGAHTWRGSVPDYSFKKVIEVLEAEDWIYNQVVTAAGRVANFTPRPAGGSAKP